MRKTKYYYLSTTIFILFILAIVLSDTNLNQRTALSDCQVYNFSFENDMEGWESNGIDPDYIKVEWNIERSQDISSEGRMSVRLYLNNLYDSGQIWIERPFKVEPNRIYKINTSYDLASADADDIVPWIIIVGTVSMPSGMETVYQRNTRNDAKHEDGFVWLRKNHSFIADSSPSGELKVTIGICGKEETARTYYLDNINISFSSK